VEKIKQDKKISDVVSRVNVGITKLTFMNKNLSDIKGGVKTANSKLVTVNLGLKSSNTKLDKINIGINKLVNKENPIFFKKEKEDFNYLSEQHQLESIKQTETTNKLLREILKNTKGGINVSTKGGSGILGFLLGGALAKAIILPLALAAKTLGMGGKVAGGVVGGSVLGKVLGKVPGLKGVGKAVGKRLPGAGAVIGTGLAYNAWKGGDLTGAGLEMASGVSSFVPVFGTAMSMGIDLINNLRKKATDALQGLKENVSKEDVEKGFEGVTDFLGVALENGIKGFNDIFSSTFDAMKGVDFSSQATWESMFSDPDKFFAPIEGAMSGIKVPRPESGPLIDVNTGKEIKEIPQSETLNTGVSVVGKVVNDTNTKAYMGYADQAAKEAGVDPYLFRGLVKQESGWSDKAVSSTGAAGLTQLMPATAKEMGLKVPEELVTMNKEFIQLQGTKNKSQEQKDRQSDLAKQMKERTKWYAENDPSKDERFDPMKNAKAGAGYLKKQIDVFGGDEVLGTAAYNAGAGAVRNAGNNIPNFGETQNYVDRVLAFAEQYKQVPITDYEYKEPVNFDNYVEKLKERYDKTFGVNKESGDWKGGKEELKGAAKKVPSLLSDVYTGENSQTNQNFADLNKNPLGFGFSLDDFKTGWDSTKTLGAKAIAELKSGFNFADETSEKLVGNANSNYEKLGPRLYELAPEVFPTKEGDKTQSLRTAGQEKESLASTKPPQPTFNMFAGGGGATPNKNQYEIQTESPFEFHYGKVLLNPNFNKA